VNPLDFLLIAVVLWSDFCVSFIVGFLHLPAEWQAYPSAD
jgi:hypothetical protein